MEPVESTEILLIFRVGTMHIGASVDSIVSIITPPATIPLPTRAGDAIRVFSYQNEPALAIELHHALGVTVDEDTLDSCIIITRLQNKLIGFRIDEAVDMAQPETYRITDADPEVWLSGGPFDYVCERDDTMILHTTFEKLGEYSNSLSGEIWSAASHVRLDQIEELAEAEKIKKTAEEESKVKAATSDEPGPEEENKQTEPDENDQLQADSGEEKPVSEPVGRPKTTTETKTKAKTTPDAEPPEATPDLPEPGQQPEKPVVNQRPPPGPAPEHRRPATSSVSRVTEKVRNIAMVEDRADYQPNLSSQRNTNQPKSRWPYVVLALLIVIAGGGWWVYDSTLNSIEADIKTSDDRNTPVSVGRSQPEAGGNAEMKTVVSKSVPESVNRPQPEAGRDVRIETDDFTIVVERNQPYKPASKPTTAPAPVDNNVIVHVVVKGDTLWHIASRYIGDPFRYPELARLSQIKDPDWIYPGNIVRIIIKKRK